MAASSDANSPAQFLNSTPQMRHKLPVPGPWQAAALAAMSALAERLSIGVEGVALTRAMEDATDPRALELWLIAQGRGYRYRARLDGDEVESLGS